MLVQDTVGRSKSGLPTIMETGGGATNTGRATIIAGPTGEPVKPLFVPKGYANSDHAIFVARVGMIIVVASHGRDGEYATVNRITAIGGKRSAYSNISPNMFDPDVLVTEVVGEYADGDYEPSVLPFQEAIKSALGKSKCYHCREAHYVV